MMMERGSSMRSRRIMVVADPGRETVGALQWVLSHAILDYDELILLHVENAASWRTTFSTFLRRPSLSSPSFANGHSTAATTTTVASTENAAGTGEVDFLEELKYACEAAQPKIKVQIERMDLGGKDKASTVLMQCRAFSVDLLVIGQRRSLSNAILGCRLSGGMSKPSSRGGMDTAEYLIENSKCTCVGVQKKGQNGGYLLNTKTHKNFWLLA